MAHHGLLIPVSLNSYNEASVNLRLYVLTFDMFKKIPQRMKIFIQLYIIYFINKGIGIKMAFVNGRNFAVLKATMKPIHRHF